MVVKLVRQVSSNTDLKRLMNNRARPGEAYVPTDVEHLANLITHGLWIGPSILGAYWMFSLAPTSMHLLTALVYGTALMALFSVSTTFHTIAYCHGHGPLKNFFHIGDRAVIYLFIAASYTPWLLLRRVGWWGSHALWIVWVMAVLGIIYQYTFHEKYKWLETVFYLIIGISPAACILDMVESSGLYEMALGGITYIAGVVFFKMDGVIPFAHAIWHIFVLVGATFHFYAVLTYLFYQADGDLMGASDHQHMIHPEL